MRRFTICSSAMSPRWVFCPCFMSISLAVRAFLLQVIIYLQRSFGLSIKCCTFWYPWNLEIHRVMRSCSNKQKVSIPRRVFVGSFKGSSGCLHFLFCMLCLDFIAAVTTLLRRVTCFNCEQSITISSSSISAFSLEYA